MDFRKAEEFGPRLWLEAELLKLGNAGMGFRLKSPQKRTSP